MWKEFYEERKWGKSEAGWHQCSLDGQAWLDQLFLRRSKKKKKWLWRRHSYQLEMLEWATWMLSITVSMLTEHLQPLYRILQKYFDTANFSFPHLWWATGKSRHEFPRVQAKKKKKESEFPREYTDWSHEENTPCFKCQFEGLKWWTLRLSKACLHKIFELFCGTGKTHSWLTYRPLNGSSHH